MQATGLFGLTPRHGTSAAELYDIEDPGPNDVLFGRGTGSNMHSGNIRFRALIQQYKPVYRDTPKKMKPSVSTKVVAIWRSQNPPGRFLTRSDRFHGSKRTFYDVGDAMARRKAAQCLREKSSKERIAQLKDDEKNIEDLLKEESDDILSQSNADCSSSSSNSEKEPDSNNKRQESAECTNSMNEGIDILDQGLFSMTPQKLSTNNTNKSAGFLNETDSSNLKPPTMKSMVFAGKQKEFGLWSSCGFSSNKKDTLSLLDTYASKLEDHNGNNDNPFQFASFDFENNNGNSADNDDQGGLSFPSLFGGGSAAGKKTAGLFDDDENEDSSPDFFGGAASSLFGGEAEEPFSSVALPTQKQDALQNFGESMPTAASLTNNLFDW